MLTSYKSAYKTWIFAKHTDMPKVPIARLLDFVINPDSGIFEAIWVQSVNGLRLLSPNDIVEWTEEEIFINNENELVESSDFPRIQKVLKSEIPIIKNQVFTKKTKENLGIVVDFSFDTISPRLLSITTRNGFLIFGTHRIINAQKIDKITKSGIIINETGLKITPEKEIKKTVKKLKSTTEIAQKEGNKIMK